MTLLPLVVAVCSLITQEANEAELADQLKAIKDSQDVPGLIAASVGEDGLIEMAAVGVRKRGSTNAISTDDQFSLGSCSKSFTSTLAAALVEDGVIDWSTTILDVWPKQPVHAGFKDVTLKQLLAHAGGLHGDIPTSAPEWSSFFSSRYTPQKHRARMCFLVLTKAPQKTKGTYSYSNLGYVVAAAMLEERGKKSFERLMADRVFKPLGMKNTEFYSVKKMKRVRGNQLWGHNSVGTPMRPGESGFENPTAYAGCGTIQTTISDWAKYVGWHLNEVAAPVLKSDDAIRGLHKTVVDRVAGREKYGFGWIHFNSRYGRTLQHAGSNTNQYALVWMMPDAKRATLVVTNTGEKQAFAACDAGTVVLMKRAAFKR